MRQSITTSLSIVVQTVCSLRGEWQKALQLTALLFISMTTFILLTAWLSDVPYQRAILIMLNDELKIQGWYGLLMAAVSYLILAIVAVSWHRLQILNQWQLISRTNLILALKCLGYGVMVAILTFMGFIIAMFLIVPIIKSGLHPFFIILPLGVFILLLLFVIYPILFIILVSIAVEKPLAIKGAYQHFKKNKLTFSLIPLLYIVMGVVMILALITIFTIVGKISGINIIAYLLVNTALQSVIIFFGIALTTEFYRAIVLKKENEVIEATTIGNA